MRNTIKKIFYVVAAVLLLCAYVYFMLIEPLMNLNNKKDLKTINTDVAYEILEIEHSINGLIPIGKEYYYVAIVKDGNEAYLVRAPKKWLQNNFNSDYTSKDSNGFTYTALPEKISDFEIKEELANRMKQVSAYTFPLGNEFCLEYSYRSIAIKKLILFAFSIILVIAGIILAKRNEKANSKVGVVYIVAIMIFLAIMITTLK